MADAGVKFLIELSATGQPVVRRVADDLKELERVGKSTSGALRTLGFGAISLNQSLELLQKVARGVQTVFDQAFGQVVRRGSELQGLSRQLSIPVQQLSAFQFAAQQANVSLEGLGQGFKALAGSLVEAERAGTKANKILVGDFGFSLAKIRQLQKDPQAAILELADAFNRYGDSAKKTQAQQELFGRGFFAMAQFMKEGRPEIEKNITLAQRLGLVMGKDASDASDRLSDSFNTLSAASLGLKTRLFGNADTLNAMARAVEGAADRIAKFTENLPQDEVDRLNEALLTMTEHLADMAASGLEAVIRSAPGFIQALDDMQSTLEVARDDAKSFWQTLKDLAADTGLLEGLRRLGDAVNGLKIPDLSGMHPGGPETSPEALSLFGDIQDRTGQRQALRRARHLALTGRAGPTPGQAPLPVGGPGLWPGVDAILAGQAVEAGSLPGSGWSQPQMKGGGGSGDTESKVQQLTAAFADLNGQIAVLRDPSKAAAVEIQGIVDKLVGLGANKDQATAVATELVGLKTRADEAKEALATALDSLKEPTLANLALLRQMEDHLRAIGDTDGLKTVVKQATDVGVQIKKDGEALDTNVRQKLEDLIDPTAKSRQEFEKLHLEADRTGHTDLHPLIDQVEQLGVVLDSVNRIFDVFGQVADDALSGFILGTRKAGEAVDALKAALVRLAVQSALGIFKNLATNLAIQLVTGQSANTGGGGSSIFGSLAQGGGILSALYGAGQGGVSAFQSGGDFSTILSSIVRGGLSGGTSSGTPPFTTGGLGQLVLDKGASAFGLGGSQVSGAVEGYVMTANGPIPIYGPSSTFGGAAPSGGFSGGASALTSAATIAGLLATTAFAAKSVKENSEVLRRVANPGAATGLTIGSSLATGASIGVGAGIGTAAGAVVGGPIGAVAGAAIGAAVAAAISQAIQSAVTGAIGKGLDEAVRNGYNQQQLNAAVKDKLFNNTLLNVLAPGVNMLLSQLFGGMVAPNIEQIFRKMFAKTFEQTGTPINRQLMGDPGTVGSARVRGNAAALEPGLRSDATTVSALVSTLIGAGNVNRERLGSFANIIINSFAQQNKSLAEAEDAIAKVVRRLNDNRFQTAIKRVGGLFRGDALARQVDLAAQAFDDVLGPIDTAATAGVFLDTRTLGSGKANRQARRASRDAVANILPDALNAPTVDQGIQAFVAQVGAALETAFGKAMTDAIVKTPIGELFSAAFRDIKKLFKDMGKVPFDQFVKQATDALHGAVGNVTKLLTDGGFLAFLREMLKLSKSIQETIDQINLQAAVDSGDRDAIRQQLEDRTASQRATLTGFQDLGRNVALRGDIAMANNPVLAARARNASLGRASDEAERRLLAAGGKPGGISEVPISALASDLPKALQLLGQYADARLTFLESELDLARQQRDYFEQVRDVFKGLQEQIEVLRFGPKGSAAILDRRLAELPALTAAATGPEGEARDKAIARLAKIAPEILQLGSSLYAPGSAQFAHVLDTVQPAVDAVEQFAKTQEDVFTEQIGKTTAAIGDLEKALGPVIDFFTTLAEGAVVQTLNHIATGIDNLPADIAQAILVDLGLDPSQFNPAGTTTTTPTAPFDSHGHPIFIPHPTPTSPQQNALVSGQSYVAGGSTPITAATKAGGMELTINVNISGASTRDMAESLAEQIRTRAVPRLVRELRAVNGG